MDSKAPPNESQRSRSFLDLPTEIRIQIYRLVLAISQGKSEWYYNMSLTCRRVRYEAFPIILKEWKFAITGLEKLLKWTRNGDPQHLELVRNISLHISHECLLWISQCRHLCKDPSEFNPDVQSRRAAKFGQYITPPPPGPMENIPTSQNLTFESNFISAVCSTIRSLRNTETFYIDLGDYHNQVYSSPSHRYQLEQQLILEAMSLALPNIVGLTVISDPLSTSYLERFHKLKYLCMSGYSTSSPGETLSTLRSLKSLDSLSFKQHLPKLHTGLNTEIYPYPTNHNLDPYALVEDLSINPEVLAQMRPLKSFRIFPYTGWHSTPCTLGMIEALRAHSKSLENLEIATKVLQDPVQGELLTEILNFLSTSPIRDFTLDFKLPQKRKSFNAKSFFPPTGKAVYIFKWTDRQARPAIYLEIKTGKYLPTPEAIAERKVLFKRRSGHNGLFEMI